jgi:quinol monooxygenase YgiN
MYMRLVQAKYQPASLSIIRKIYDDKIIPQLQKMNGCLFACLIKSENDPDEGISLTLWDSQENAESYVKSGAFQALLDEVKPYLSDSSEWKVQLSKDLKVEYQPVQEEPVIKSYYTVMASSQESPSDQTMYMRILSLNIQNGKMEQFQKIYQKEIFPVLSEVKGCRYAYLTTSVENQNEAISITIWENREDAETYEKEVFNHLLNKAKDTLSELYQWKMALEQDKNWSVMTSDDVSIKYYNLVSGKGFK